MGAETPRRAGEPASPPDGDPRHSRRRQGWRRRQPRYQRKGLSHEIQTCVAALWADARTRDALPARRAAMGRADRLVARPSHKLAAVAVLRGVPDNRPVVGTIIELDARQPTPLYRLSEPSRRGDPLLPPRHGQPDTR